MFAVEVVVGFVNLAWAGVVAQRALARIAPNAAPAGRLKRQVTRFALGYSAGIVLELIVARRSELFFLNKFSTNQQIAYFSIAYAVVTGVGQIPSALAAAAAPMFAALHGAGDHDRIRRGFERARRLLILFTVPLTAAGLALGPRIIGVIYGSQYSPTAVPLMILLATYPLRGTTSLADAVAIAYGKLRLPIVTNWIAAAVDIGLALALIPFLDARGAAIASTVAQLVYSVTVMLYVRRLIGGERFDLRLARVVAASAAAGAAGWGCVEALDGVDGLLLGLVAFVAVFAVSAIALHIIPAIDAEWIEDAVGERLGHRARRAVHLFAAAS
jgi:O-antigen/teichoic acid export membrane protein